MPSTLELFDTMLTETSLKRITREVLFPLNEMTQAESRVFKQGDIPERIQRFLAVGDSLGYSMRVDWLHSGVAVYITEMF